MCGGLPVQMHTRARRPSSIPSWVACANHRPGSHERSLRAVVTTSSALRRPHRGGAVPFRLVGGGNTVAPGAREQRTSTIDTVTLLAAAVELRETLGDVPLSVELPGGR